MSIGTSEGLTSSSAQHLTPRRVVGIDLSMTSTGLALISDGSVHTHVVKSKSDAGTLNSFLERSHLIARTIDAKIGIGVSDLVVIEGMSFGSKSRSLDKIHGHWWMVVQFLCDFLVQEPVVIAPSARAKYATGKGNASKDAVLAAAIKRYPLAAITGNDIADAVILAAMGARHIGQPIEESLPQVNLTAMEAVRWTS
ncbi:hypothetical protein [Cryobacterium soli]|uniref:hypothetical protein n=1 Tax=Cryobacterium soli TaxID=2220095 RepID=UPI000E738C60|nr:hypothetical protein [Cryobacterium soli]